MPPSGDNSGLATPLRAAGWGAAAALILAPLLAMRIAGVLHWDPGDLVFAFLLIAGTGLAFELAMRVSPSWAYRCGAALALGAGFLSAWGDLAVGFIGSEENPLNVIYFYVLAVAMLGALAALFRAVGLWKAMVAAAIAQVAIAGVALYHGHFTGPLTIFFTGLWLASARLFYKAARACPEAAVHSPRVAE